MKNFNAKWLSPFTYIKWAIWEFFGLFYPPVPEVRVLTPGEVISKKLNEAQVERVEATDLRLQWHHTEKMLLEKIKLLKRDLIEIGKPDDADETQPGFHNGVES